MSNCKFTITVFRIQCYVSVITEKDDLSFQLTYQALTFDFQTTNCGRTCSTQYFKGYSGTRPTYFKYTDFSTTYHRSAQLAKKDLSFQRLVISKAIKENTKRYIENTLHRRKIEMVNALRVQQFTHPRHPNSSFRLSYLLRQFFFLTKREKCDRQRRQKYNERKEQTRQNTGKTFLFSEK